MAAKSIEHFKSSRLQMLLKIGVLKNLAILAENHHCWSLLLIKFQAGRTDFLNRTSTVAGSGILANFARQEYFSLSFGRNK